MCKELTLCRTLANLGRQFIKLCRDDMYLKFNKNVAIARSISDKTFKGNSQHFVLTKQSFQSFLFQNFKCSKYMSSEIIRFSGNVKLMCYIAISKKLMQ